MTKASSIGIFVLFTLNAVPFNVTYAQGDGATNLFEEVVVTARRREEQPRLFPFL